MPKEVLPRAVAQFGTGELRYASVGMLLIGAAMATSYFTPAAAQNSQKIFEVPASKVRAMTPSEREQAKAYARQHGIRWRIVEGK
jgi:1,2-phenylacetyl-CoA epoxidase PaaB subunit